MSETPQTIGFLGGGHMTRALLQGIASSRTFPISDLAVYDRNTEKNTALQRDFGVNALPSATALIQEADILVLSIKPQGMRDTLAQLKDEIIEHTKLVISVAAGVKITSLSRWLGEALPMVRVMPNTPSAIGMGASALLASASANNKLKQAADNILRSVGATVWVHSDDDMDAVTALSGSGPAYFMMMLDAMINRGIDAGLEPDIARKLGAQTMAGVGQMIRDSNDDIQELITHICSPGGTTERAVHKLREANLGTIVATAFDAARTRASELGEALDDR